jgi:hypothetical protein
LPALRDLRRSLPGWPRRFLAEGIAAITDVVVERLSASPCIWQPNGA